MKQLKFFKLHGDVQIPEFATAQSSCFDIRAFIPDNTNVKVFGDNDDTYPIYTCAAGLLMRPGERALIPTGFIMDIPVGYSVRIHPRSGLALKHALTLANAEGVIDSDYIDQTYIALVNNSTADIILDHNMRIAQAELVLDTVTELCETVVKPVQKTDRNGGFGSTGTD